MRVPFGVYILVGGREASFTTPSAKFPLPFSTAHGSPAKDFQMFTNHILKTILFLWRREQILSTQLPHMHGHPLFFTEHSLAA